MILQCEQCGARYKIDSSKIPEKRKRVRCARCRHVFTISPPRKCIVVAKADNEFCRSVKELLRELPFDLLTSKDGVEALEMIRRHHPSLVILDVALPKLYGFEIAEMLKSDPETQDIRILLLAAIHDKTRYKRQPESLYGADDYIEAHHINDRLLPKIRALLPDLVVQSDDRRKPDHKPVDEIRSEKRALDEETRKMASRLARIIISDIALYNEKKVEEGVRDGDLEERMAPELGEALEMMQQRFPNISDNLRNELLDQELNALRSKAKMTPNVS
jgi:predicted Zn finger-like uncharacterized protein